MDDNAIVKNDSNKWWARSPSPSPRYYIICSRENCSAVNERLNISNHGRVKMYGGRSSRRIIRVKMRRVAGALLARTFPNDYFSTNDSFHVETLIRIFVLIARPTHAQANSINKHHAQNRANHLINVFVRWASSEILNQYFSMSVPFLKAGPLEILILPWLMITGHRPLCHVVQSFARIVQKIITGNRRESYIIEFYPYFLEFALFLRVFVFACDI